MSTSSQTFNTPERIIRNAMQNAGLLAAGQDPDSYQLSQYMTRLNDLINFMQTRGLKLWLNELVTIPLVAGQALYTINPTGNIAMTKPLRVLQGSFIDQYQITRPLLTLSRDEYMRLSTPTQQGSVNSYFTDKQQLSLNVYLWLTPDSFAALGTVQLLLQTQVQNLVSLTDTMNFPMEWFIALHWILADDISTGQPQDVIDRCAQKAAGFMAALEDWDVEDASTSFAPDQRASYQMGAFK
jgi:hypothetical protein